MSGDPRASSYRARQRNFIHEGCDGKHGFETGAEAVKAAQNIKKKNKGGVNTYRCEICRKFHIGRSPSAHGTFKKRR